MEGFCFAVREEHDYSKHISLVGRHLKGPKESGLLKNNVVILI